MNILTISGSSRPQSTNIRLLESLPHLFPHLSFERYITLDQLPLFKAATDHFPWPKEVLKWRRAINQSDALIICTPEYLHNLPALIKNALEWLTSSGELMKKPVLAITFTPIEPRGEKAMQSLLWSLQALDARIVAQLPLYQQEVRFLENGSLKGVEAIQLLKEGMRLLR
jgi:NAD(P)H-dependent FMN reductase